MRILLMSFFVVSVVCGAEAPATLRVCASLPPLLDVIRSVGGDRVEAWSLMDETQDPHTFAASPKTLARLGDADLLVTLGVGFEKAIVDKLARIHPDLPRCQAAAELLDADDCDAHEDHNHHAHEHHTDGHGTDPHVWLSLPRLAAMAPVIAKSLATIDPQGADLYTHNAAAFTERIHRAHAKLKQDLAPLRGTRFYVYHPVLGYVAKDYGLIQKAVEIDGKSPSPKQLLSVISQAKADGVKVIFVQPQFPQRAADILAERTGGRIVPMNALSSNPEAVIQTVADTLLGR